VLEFVRGHEISAKYDTRGSFKSDPVLVKDWTAEKLWQRVVRSTSRLFPYPGNVMDDEDTDNTENIFTYTMELLNGEIPTQSVLDLHHEAEPPNNALCFVVARNRGMSQSHREREFNSLPKTGQFGMYTGVSKESYRGWGRGHEHIDLEKYEWFRDHKVVSHYYRSGYEYEDNCGFGSVGSLLRFDKSKLIFLRNNQSEGDTIRPGDIVEVRGTRRPVFVEAEDDVYEEFDFLEDRLERRQRQKTVNRGGTIYRQTGTTTMDELVVGNDYTVLEVDGNFAYLAVPPKAITEQTSDDPEYIRKSDYDPEKDGAVIGITLGQLVKNDIPMSDTRPEEEIRTEMRRSVFKFFEEFGIIRRSTALRQLVASYAHQGKLKTTPKGIIQSLGLTYEEMLVCCEVMKYAHV